MKNTIRLQKIELNNVKNVANGKVVLPSYITKNNKSDILGIYGQNGSGKTSLIDAFCIAKQLMSGMQIEQSINDYILVNKDEIRIVLLFYLIQNNIEYYIEYSFEISKKLNKATNKLENYTYSDENIQISKEKMSFKKKTNEKWSAMNPFIDYDILYSENEIFSPKNNYNELKKGIKSVQVDLEVAKKMSLLNNRSFIFSEEIISMFLRNNKLEEFGEIIDSLRAYAIGNLLIIKKESFGLINLGLFLPFNFRIKGENQLNIGELNIELKHGVKIPKNVLDMTYKIIKQMNTVLTEIIPGLTIELRNFGEQIDGDGNNVYNVQLLSVREHTTIPLRNESGGVKKLISMLSYIIAMYNNSSICLLIDELDSGIFEYLLGELLRILQEKGKGQLIFTSHNLRPLEVLDKENIIFTTTNSENRYIRYINLQTNNNLRDCYYRTINIGGQKENLYDKTKHYKIDRALRIAGSEINDAD